MIELKEAVIRYLDEHSDAAFNAIAFEHYRYIQDKYFCSLWRILDRPENDILALNMMFSLLDSFHATFFYQEKNKYEWYKNNAFKSAENWKSISDLRNAVVHTVSPPTILLTKSGLLAGGPQRYIHNIEDVYSNIKRLFEDRMTSLISGDASDSERCTFLYNLLRFEDEKAIQLQKLKLRITK